MSNHSQGLVERVVNQAQYFEHSLVPPFPTKNMLIELSNICNHRCIFCANKKMKRKKGYMPFDFLTRILKEAYANGTREVGFYATGEPLVYSRISEAVKLAKDIGYEYVYITTNGALLVPDKAIELVKAGIDSIKFSINAGSKKTYELIHGKNDFETVIDNLKFLHNYRSENSLNFKIYISFVVTRYTLEEIDNFKQQYSSYSDEIAFYAASNQAGLNSEIGDLLLINENHNNFNIIKGLKHIPCSRLFNGLTITYEGYLSCCCVDFENQLIVADLKKMSLEEAWKCQKFQDFRKAHLEHNVKNTMCQNCMSYSKTPFQPLSVEFATPIDFNEIYKDDFIIERLNKLGITRI